MTVYIADLV